MPERKEYTFNGFFYKRRSRLTPKRDFLCVSNHAEKYNNGHFGKGTTEICIYHFNGLTLKFSEQIGKAKWGDPPVHYGGLTIYLGNSRRIAGTKVRLEKILGFKLKEETK